MLLVIRARTTGLRRVPPFAISLCLHGALLVWMLLGPPLPMPERPKPIYAMEIAPYADKIVWYTVRDRLPDVTPTEAAADRRPPRARAKAEQTIVSGPKDDDRPPQRIWMPKPQVVEPKPMALPNVIAVPEPPKVLKPFTDPAAQARPKIEAPVLPEAPKTATAEVKPLPIATPGIKPQPLAFTPPPEVRMQRQANLELPEAPVAAMIVQPKALPFVAPGARPERKAYTPPAGFKQREEAPLALPAAPEVASAAALGTSLKGVPRTFIAPPERPARTPAAPTVTVEAPAMGDAPADASLAIVGLNPAKTTELPAPPGSRSAGFSAGPEPRPTGGAGAVRGAALLGVPDLLVRGGPKDSQPTLLMPSSGSQESLLAAARLAPHPPTLPSRPPEPGAAPMSEVPDPRLAGRVVYALAVQMPNVTSFSGSWLVWFAEHEPVPGDPAVNVKPPVPRRKVDPKYVASAVADRIEGKVRLFGVIRKDGRVEGVSLIQHLDARLDRSAAEALVQWIFDPATANGRPMDVDAVFEIPFHLAPRPTK